jgi:hypothetical protein
MLATDQSLRLALGCLHPLVIRATAVAPSQRWVTEARRVLAMAPDQDLSGAIRRTLASLVRSDIVSRPDILAGGLRLTNQRLARALLWFASVALDAPAELIGSVGVRMGTSGRSDAVVRDTAVANTCAALLGVSIDPGAAAALATMRVRVTNRNVLKQVARALEAVAARAGMPVAAVIELSLPTFGLGPNGRIELPIDGTTAVIAVTDDATVRQVWRDTDGTELERAPAALATTHPAEVADVDGRVAGIAAAILEERRRMDDRLASSRAWPVSLWRSRYTTHPIGRIFGVRLIWQVISRGGVGVAARWDGDGWIDVDSHRLALGASLDIRLWHPADADDVEIAAWRASLSAEGMDQPVKQAHREVFRPAPSDVGLAADRRFAGRIVGHGHLRSRLRGRGWAVPALGPWDQGDEATAFREFEDGSRAELRYQAIDQVPTGMRQERARLVAVRFMSASGADAVQLPLSEVRPRVFSEAVRDVSLVANAASAAASD